MYGLYMVYYDINGLILINKGWYGIGSVLAHKACEADVSSVSRSSEQTVW